MSLCFSGDRLCMTCIAVGQIDVAADAHTVTCTSPSRHRCALAIYRTTSELASYSVCSEARNTDAIAHRTSNCPTRSPAPTPITPQNSHAHPPPDPGLDSHNSPRRHHETCKKKKPRGPRPNPPAKYL
ncbi:hypothetical protein K439DRAFT_535216 [Ramaria rubella]|nr:hypothetical protein K439DRAFT_535216 [Ramaria rubella]